MSAWERYRAVSVGWQDDGHPHERTEAGFCQSCGARGGEGHYRLVRKQDVTGSEVAIEVPDGDERITT